MPKASRRRDGHLALIVNNTGTATLPAIPKWADDFDLDESEIKKGVEEW
jgi:hypothetical protein